MAAKVKQQSTADTQRNIGGPSLTLKHEKELSCPLSEPTATFYSTDFPVLVYRQVQEQGVSFVDGSNPKPPSGQSGQSVLNIPQPAGDGL